MRSLVVLGLLAGCRLHFDPLAVESIGDGGVDGDLENHVSEALACGSPAPFLYLIAPREEGSGSAAPINVQWCADGLSGTLVASLLESTQFTVFRTASAPVADGTLLIETGGSSCGSCFVRLEADGLAYHGPVGFHAGD